MRFLIFFQQIYYRIAVKRALNQFKKNVVVLLDAVSSYLTSIADYFFDHSVNVLLERNAFEKKWERFPEWVYARGFNLYFQEGHRHFLVRLEQIREILHGLDYLAHKEYNGMLVDSIKEPVLSYVSAIKNIIVAINTVLNSHFLKEGLDNHFDSFEKIEKTFAELVPFSLEGLDIRDEYVFLANFIEELKQLGRHFYILARTLR